MKVLIQGQLHGGDANTHPSGQSLDSFAWIFYLPFLQFLDRHLHANAVRKPAMFLAADHSFVVSVAAVHAIFYSLYSVHKALGSRHNVGISTLSTNHHDMGNSFSLSKQLPILHVT